MEDERLSRILTEREKALSDNNNTYQDIINKNQNLYNQQIDYIDRYEQAQNDIAKTNLEQNQRMINRQKEEAQRSTDVENQKAYNTYQKVINPYGVDSESLGGLNNSGYSETFKLGAYNQYQDRVGRANVALRDAITSYDEALTKAKETYDVTAAQNALAKLQMGLQYAQSYNENYANYQMNRLNSSQNINSTYDNSYRNMLSQIQNERELEERIRQYNSDLAERQRQYDSNMAYQRERDKIADNQWQQEYNLSRYNAYSKKNSEPILTGKNEKEILEENDIDSTSTNALDGLGNSAETQKKSNYYWKNSDGTYTNQPSYIENTRLTKSGKTASEIGVAGNGIGNDYRVWKANGKYYVWNSNLNTYLDVTDEYNRKNGGNFSLTSLLLGGPGGRAF